jgi:AraC-like DNA-binding protein
MSHRRIGATHLRLPGASRDQEARRRSCRFQGAEGLEALGRHVPVETDSPDELHVAVHTARFGAVRLTWLRHGSMRVRMGGEPRQRLRVLVVLEGEITLRLGGTLEVVGPRDAVRLVQQPVVRFEATETTSALLIDVDASDPRYQDALSTANFAVWQQDTVVPAATAQFLLEVLRRDDDKLHPAARADLVPLVEQLSVGLATMLPTRPEPFTHHPLDKSRVLRHIAAHYAEPGLCPTSIANKFGVSTRTLHRVFEEDERSVMQWIAAVRLEQALARLADPRCWHLPIEELATLTGHGSALTLRRAVQAATGMTPSRYRRMHAAA